MVFITKAFPVTASNTIIDLLVYFSLYSVSFIILIV